MQIDAGSYLAAGYSDIEGEVKARHLSLALNRLIEVMEKAGTTTNSIFLDP